MTDWFYQELRLPGPLPGLNDMVASGPNGRFRYNRLKKRWAETIAYLCASQAVRPIRRAQFSYLIIEPTRRRDPVNFCAGAVKFIEDAMQAAGYLENDGWDNVESYSFKWRLTDTIWRPGVVLYMNACEEWKETADERRQKGRNKFGRGAAGHQGLQKLARKTQNGRSARQGAKVPVRGVGR